MTEHRFNQQKSWQNIEGVNSCPNCGFAQPMWVMSYPFQPKECHWAGCEWSGKLKEKTEQKKFEGMRL